MAPLFVLLASTERDEVSVIRRNVSGADASWRGSGWPVSPAPGEPPSGRLDMRTGGAGRRCQPVGARSGGMGQMPLHGIPGQPEIGGDRVEAPHHLGFGHDRQPEHDSGNGMASGDSGLRIAGVPPLAIRIWVSAAGPDLVTV